LKHNTNTNELNNNNKTFYTEVIKLQQEFAKKVITKDNFNGNVKSICGVDVSYRKKVAYCSAVIIDKENFEVIETVSSESEIKYPYIPGLFILREAGPILQTLKLITKSFQLLLVDGHGVLHPRKCGLACFIGISINHPTIGVAKSLLCGNLRSDNFVSHKGEILGYALKPNNNSKKVVYVSVGHKISLPTSIELVKTITKINHYIPEPLRVADKLSREQISDNSNLLIN
jgi:deoxyribonuclease V